MSAMVRDRGCKEAEKRQIAELFDDHSGVNAIFGINEFSDHLIDQFQIDFIIDEFTSDTSYRGVPICTLEALPANAVVVSTVIGRPNTVKSKLDSIGVQNLDYFFAAEVFAHKLPAVRRWPEFRTDYAEHRAAYERLYALLSDDKSCEVFRDIVEFRCSANLDVMANYTDLQDLQYFEPFLNLERDGETFLDIGGFHGETSLQFVANCPGFNRIHFFEPDFNNRMIAKSNLENIRSVTTYGYGLGSEDKEVSFKSAGSCSSAVEHGESTIKIKSFDSAVRADCTFLKIDIEGGELDAINGMSDMIKRCHPKMAISVYHNPTDLRVIPEKIRSIRDDYRLFLRHYTEGVDETVMFFCPH